MTILTGPAIGEAARQICQSEGERYLAVSYWSGGSSDWLLKDAELENLHVVLDVNAGGTSPDEFRNLQSLLGDRLRVHPDLHAKTFSSEVAALVGSANATRPGLQIRPDGRLELAAHIEGSDAAEAFLNAKTAYQAGSEATNDHYGICELRYRRNGLNVIEAGQIAPLNFLAALSQQPHLYEAMPLIYTDQKLEDIEGAAQAFADLGVGEDLNWNYWDVYEFEFPPEIFNEKCVALHIGSQGGMSVAIVRPIAAQDDFTFVQRVLWREVPGFEYNGRGARYIQDGYDAIWTAIEDFEGARITNMLDLITRLRG